jgi:hypothetical protein
MWWWVSAFFVLLALGDNIAAVLAAAFTMSNVAAEGLVVEYSKETMGRCALVTQLLCRKLWRGTNRGHPAVHRTAADTALKPKIRTALPSALLTPP